MMNGKGEARPLLKHSVMVEQYKKDDRHYQLYTHFTPSFSSQSVTGKFYSKYDQNDPTICDQKYLEMIRLRSVAVPKDKYPQPVVESQLYGWYTQPLIDFDKSDERLHHPSTTSEISRFGALLQKATRR